MTLSPETKDWIAAQTGHPVRDEHLWTAALTHGSTGEDFDYQRLEFLGDRVLGLSIAEWLYEKGGDTEGKLSQRLNALVSRQSCARVAREIDLSAHMRLGKQARADGGLDSDNILGDIIESLIGACQVDHGFEVARALVRKWFGDAVEGRAGRKKHPKSALQEWAAGNRRKPPEYELLDRSGPDHASRFTVRVSVRGVGEATGEGDSKQQAETAAATAFLDQHG
ncbi:ribonuclease III [Croceicoccus pelagius]|uniref:Ribonuclease 3 n=1 Tax=Croceicoccus pelagius TaxID=1703341 RepID=A0A916YGH0_9SPHN|nr:ribonuclease III [Croceicoccus pelagius]GGD43682.1 ribonuclease 3 [Croceicoccus pelagius]